VTRTREVMSSISFGGKSVHIGTLKSADGCVHREAFEKHDAVGIGQLVDP